MPISIPLINGVRHSFASINAKVGGRRFLIASLNYSEKQTTTKVRGNSPIPVGMPIGDYDVSGDFEMCIEEFTDFLRVLAPSGQGYMTKMFDLDFTYEAEGNPYIINHLIVGARMTEISSSRSQGNEGLREKATFEALQMKRDGKFGLDINISLTF
jgi:hypothetical protein